jgi:4a-hydroxytetrahydrobiopterin dehydratase
MAKKTGPDHCDLSNRKCVPCEGGVPPLGQAEIEKLMPQVSGWRIAKGKLVRHVEFDDFLTLMDFVNDVAQIAEEQGHHPDFSVHYNKLDLELWTHAIDGLSENDFIMGARINALLGDRD